VPQVPATTKIPRPTTLIGGSELSNVSATESHARGLTPTMWRRFGATGVGIIRSICSLPLTLTDTENGDIHIKNKFYGEKDSPQTDQGLMLGRRVEKRCSAGF